MYNKVKKYRSRLLAILLIIFISVLLCAGAASGSHTEAHSNVSGDSSVVSGSTESISEDEKKWLPSPNGEPSDIETSSGSSRASPNQSNPFIPDIGFNNEVKEDQSISTTSRYDSEAGILPTTGSGDTRYESYPPSTSYGLKTVRITYNKDEYEANSLGFCTGSIISSYHVLTAAHCFYDPNDQPIHNTNYFNKSDILVEPGVYYSQQIGDVVRPRHFAKIDKLHIDPDYDPSPILSSSYDHDIAVITLDRPIGSETGAWSYLIGSPLSSNYQVDSVTGSGYPGNTFLPSIDNEPDNFIEGDGKGLGVVGGIPNYRHKLQVDLSGGQSGGPAWTRGSELSGVNVGDDEAVILSVMTGGDNGTYSNRDYNIGTRIGSGKENFITNSVNNGPQPDFKPDLFDGVEYDYWIDNTEINSPPSAKKNSNELMITKGENIFLNHSVHNVGMSEANNVKIEYYISDDTTFKPSRDIKIATRSIGSISTFSKYNISVKTQISAQSGKYLVYRVIDPENNISEYKAAHKKKYDFRKVLNVTSVALPQGAVYSDPNGVPANYDSDNNGQISQGELVDGLQSYSNNNISQADLVDLLQAYSKST